MLISRLDKEFSMIMHDVGLWWGWGVLFVVCVSATHLFLRKDLYLEMWNVTGSPRHAVAVHRAGNVLPL